MPFDPSAAPAAGSADADTEPGTAPTRRGMLLGVGLAGLAGTLTACGGSGAKSASGGGGLGKSSDIPVGGGKIFKDQKIVVTQPKKGEFVAFSAVCTHRGCTVGTVSDGTIDCPCHGSKFHISDGSVAHGPAAQPLPSKSVKVENGEIKLA
ncbi:Rieske (2Fe-2S) protein [Actinoallomurus sp. NPDC050550]|uniref:Rieske (2Fe-2S) protein n=1 Tax=Actinoallomurus sp. NPDC050550 TaxID=3154937 RepID=UPI0033C27710